MENGNEGLCGGDVMGDIWLVTKAMLSGSSSPVHPTFSSHRKEVTLSSEELRSSWKEVILQIVITVEMPVTFPLAYKA